ncbi:hypothetical protein Sa4125_30960 [Aureimonas sp. SA4125]|nr:hypothetical protein Sa4125_30960 [Aureimonas sp. SA4125]
MIARISDDWADDDLVERFVEIAISQDQAEIESNTMRFNRNYPPPCHGPNSLNPWTDGSR